MPIKVLMALCNYNDYSYSFFPIDFLRDLWTWAAKMVRWASCTDAPNLPLVDLAITDFNLLFG
jgi:hypothetical protein